MGDRLAPLGALPKPSTSRAAPNLQHRLNVDSSSPLQQAEESTLQRLAEQAAGAREQALHFWQDPMIRKSLFWLFVVALGIALVVVALIRLTRVMRKRPTLAEFIGLGPRAVAVANGSGSSGGAAKKRS